MKIWGTYESEAAKILRKKIPIMNKMDEEYTISYDVLIHPDLEAIARRDTFLNQPLARNIQFSEEGITADIDCDICEYPNECENCARAIEDRER